MSDVRLVLSDVDGTLVAPSKELTTSAIDAVRHLREHDVLFALTSGRPPRGMSMLFDPLAIDTPVSAFNGGLVVDRSMSTLKELTIDDEVAISVIDVLRAHDVSVWVFQGTEWFVLDEDGPHVEHEAAVCQFSPTVVSSFDGVRGQVVKVVGVTDATANIDAARGVLNDTLAGQVSATNSQSYYLDVTHRDANKGSVVDYLAAAYGIEACSIAVIGDMANDLLMFERAGVSIAMGNGSDEVRATADFVTKHNDDDGFAYAIEHFILG